MLDALAAASYPALSDGLTVDMISVSPDRDGATNEKPQGDLSCRCNQRTKLLRSMRASCEHLYGALTW
jgi:hypothetical protein